MMNDNLKEKISLLMNNLELLYKENKPTFEEFLKDYSSSVDKVILDIQSKENLLFLTGKLKGEVVENELVQFMLELYFKNNEDKFTQKTLSSNPIELADYIKESEIPQVLENQHFEFEIMPPIKSA